MTRVSVNTDEPTPYLESETKLHRFKRKLTYRHAFRLLKKHLQDRTKPSILEIGTGSGFFMEFANDEFPGSDLHGIEYDHRLLEVTKKRAPFANCQQGNAEAFDLGPNQFDAIVSFQVIEHLYNPDAMLENVYRHLKPDGIFLVTTPNLGCASARKMKEQWHGYREDHVSLKTKSQWDAAIAAHNLKPIYTGSTFFSGIPILNSFPLGIVNWFLLLSLGSLPWNHGESYVAVFERASLAQSETNQAL